MIQWEAQSKQRRQSQIAQVVGKSMRPNLQARDYGRQSSRHAPIVVESIQPSLAHHNDTYRAQGAAVFHIFRHQEKPRQSFARGPQWSKGRHQAKPREPLPSGPFLALLSSLACSVDGRDPTTNHPSSSIWHVSVQIVFSIYDSLKNS